jgi:hypothetical protein
MITDGLLRKIAGRVLRSNTVFQQPIHIRVHLRPETGLATLEPF